MSGPLEPAPAPRDRDAGLRPWPRWFIRSLALARSVRSIGGVVGTVSDRPASLSSVVIPGPPVETHNCRDCLHNGGIAFECFHRWPSGALVADACRWCVESGYLTGNLIGWGTVSPARCPACLVASGEYHRDHCLMLPVDWPRTLIGWAVAVASLVACWVAS